MDNQMVARELVKLARSLAADERTARSDDVAAFLYSVAHKQGIDAKKVVRAKFEFVGISGPWVEGVVIDRDGVDHKIAVDLKIASVSLK